MDFPTSEEFKKAWQSNLRYIMFFTRKDGNRGYIFGENRNFLVFYSGVALFEDIIILSVEFVEALYD